MSLSRIPAMNRQGTSGYRSVNEGGRFFTASPRISRFLMTASCVLISPVNSSYVISEVYDRMRSTASAISAQRRWVFDRSGIGDLDGHPLPYGRFESVRGHQVDGGAEVK
ncbi:hypothetical protein DSECCO2_529900 [anaerobic digester metagenome]